MFTEWNVCVHYWLEWYNFSFNYLCVLHMQILKSYDLYHGAAALLVFTLLFCQCSIGVWYVGQYRIFTSILINHPGQPGADFCFRAIRTPPLSHARYASLTADFCLLGLKCGHQFWPWPSPLPWINEVWYSKSCMYLSNGEPDWCQTKRK